MAESKKNWYVVYTKPRWEKKVHMLLAECGVEAYCPMNRTYKKWSDRMKWVEEPLFKSYVFVRISEDDLATVRMVSGVVNFVYWLGKPALVRNKEIEVIRKFLNEYKDVQAVSLDLKEETRVTILKGAFMDKKARIVRVLNNKVQVIIESIGYSLVAVIDKSNAAMIGKK